MFGLTYGGGVEKDKRYAWLAMIINEGGGDDDQRDSLTFKLYPSSGKVIDKLYCAIRLLELVWVSGRCFETLSLAKCWVIKCGTVYELFH